MFPDSIAFVPLIMIFEGYDNNYKFTSYMTIGPYSASNS